MRASFWRVLRTSASRRDLQQKVGFLVADAQLLRAEGRPAEALELATEALAAGTGPLGITFLSMKQALVEALEAAFALGDTEKVRELVSGIDALRPGERPPLLEAHAHRFRAKLAGDEAGFKNATALFRELSIPFWLAVTLLEHSELTGDESLLAEAREIFERLGAVPWLERVGTVLQERVTV